MKPRIALIAVGPSLINYGFRVIASIAKQVCTDVQVYFLSLENIYSFRTLLFNKQVNQLELHEKDIKLVAKELAQADIVGFSCLTIDAKPVRQIISEIRSIKPETFIIWGGIHAISDSNDAIQYADAVCISQGERVFKELIVKYINGENYSDTKSFWFKQDTKIIKNDYCPLMTSEMMDTLPPPHYGKDELIYKRGKGFVPLKPVDYVYFQGLTYNTIWTQGCPFKCTYCMNSKLCEIDKTHKNIKHASVKHIISEIEEAQKTHPHISTVNFHDDSFLALSEDVLSEFAREWKEKIKLPFAVQGINPHYVNKDKIEILLDAGMNRIRMGIQSGSDRILKFYKRPTKPQLIRNSTEIISRYSKYMIPPGYDLIVDTPIETQQDVQDTLRLVYEMKRPFTINVFSIRIIPNTELEKQVKELGIEVDNIESNYIVTAPTFATAMLFFTAVIRLPRPVFEYLLRFAKPLREKQKLYPILLLVARTLFYTKRVFDQIRFMDFSIFPSRLLWIPYKLGIINFWHKHMVKKFVRG